jgi:hypothetical protein
LNKTYKYHRTYIFHYSEATGQITEITHHPDSLWRDISGDWNRPLCKMNLGVDSNNNLFATWTKFDTIDCSAGGNGNGDIYMSYSINEDRYWSTPQNLTNSQTPGCFPGLCDSDHWSTLAEKVDDSLHIVYINDKDAGGSPYDEGAATENPVMYLTVPNPVNQLADYKYLPADVNMEVGLWPPQVISNDVTYLVNYFRGEADPCLLDGFFASADANGDCMVIGGDVIWLVNYFRGLNDLLYCPDYPSAWPTPDDLPAEAPSSWPNCE